MTYKQHLINSGMPRGLAALAADLLDLSTAGFNCRNMDDNLRLAEDKVLHILLQAANDDCYLLEGNRE